MIKRVGRYEIIREDCKVDIVKLIAAAKWGSGGISLLKKDSPNRDH